MFRTFRITVNGKGYDVTVEETGGGPGASVLTPAVSSVSGGQVAPAAAAAISVPASARQVSAAIESSPVTAPIRTATAVPSGALGAGVIKAPIPGTVTTLKVAENQSVKKGDVVLILEAMKMENEICAPDDGTVSRLYVQTGAMVNTGDPLLEVS